MLRVGLTGGIGSGKSAVAQRLAIADIVIDNSGTLDDLDRHVAQVWAQLRGLAEDRPAGR